MTTLDFNAVELCGPTECDGLGELGREETVAEIEVILRQGMGTIWGIYLILLLGIGGV